MKHLPSISRLRANDPVFLKQPAIANIRLVHWLGVFLITAASRRANSTQEGLTKTILVNFDKETLQRMLDFMLSGTYDGLGLYAVPASPPPDCENDSVQGNTVPWNSLLLKGNDSATPLCSKQLRTRCRIRGEISCCGSN